MTGGGVVAGPVALGHADDLPVELGDDLFDERVAGDREAEPGADEPLRAALGVGQGHERVEHGPARVSASGSRPSEPDRWATTVSGSGLDGGGHLGHDGVGGGDHHQVDVGRRRRRSSSRPE